jgi:hypothetical protein
MGWSSPYLALSRSTVACGKPLLAVPRPAGHGVHQEERDDRDREQHRDDPQERRTMYAITVRLV